MIKQLLDLEEQLPLMLHSAKWESLKINKYPPVIHRLSTDIGNGNKILLHRLFHCGESRAYLHSHSWPFAIKVLEGGYEMGMGFSDKRDTPPEITVVVQVKPGDTYQITSTNVWHYTKPIEQKESWSVMLIGPRVRPRKAQNIDPLSKAEQDSMFEYFVNYYSGHCL